MPKCPRGLGKVARQTWDEVIRVVAPSGLLTQADSYLVEQFCVAYERWRDARAKLKRKGFEAVIEGRNGGLYPNPWIMVSDRADERMTILMEKLGMDPESRMDLEVEVGPKLADDDNDRFFKEREARA